jgi:hypothetical protein
MWIEFEGELVNLCKFRSISAAYEIQDQLGNNFQNVLIWVDDNECPSYQEYDTREELDAAYDYLKSALRCHEGAVYKIKDYQ